MTLLRGSRYSGSVFIPIRQSNGTVKGFITPRFGFTPDDINNDCSLHTYMPGDTLEAISFRYYGTQKAWYIIAEFNGISFPYDIQAQSSDKIIKLVIPPYDFVLAEVG